MTKAEFEELLEKAVILYAIKENERYKELDESDDVPFSIEHQRKMKELFELVRKMDEKNCRN